MYERFKAKPWLCRLSAGYYGCVHGWKKPIQEVLEPLKYAHGVGLECGDVEFAMINVNIYSWTRVSWSSSETWYLRLRVRTWTLNASFERTHPLSL